MGARAAPPRWRTHYARERDALGVAGMDRLLACAPALALPVRGAVVAPHVHLGDCGAQLASLANAIVISGARDVLGIGPLHRLAGALGAEQAALQRAGTYIGSRFTGLHGPDGLAADEFCWDSLAALLARACELARVPPPRLHLRSACALPDACGGVGGMAQASQLLASGAVLVATIDHLHQGIGYGDERAHARDDHKAATARWAAERIHAACAAAGAARWRDLRARCAADRSDGCDVLLTLAHLIPGAWTVEILDLALASYADALAAERPTWVAAALVRILSAAR